MRYEGAEISELISQRDAAQRETLQIAEERDRWMVAYQGLPAEIARLRALLARLWRAWNGSCQVCDCQFCQALDAAMAEAEKEVAP